MLRVALVVTVILACIAALKRLYPIGALARRLRRGPGYDSTQIVACQDCWTRRRSLVRGELRCHADGLREYLCDACWSRYPEPRPRGMDPVTVEDGRVVTERRAS